MDINPYEAVKNMSTSEVAGALKLLSLHQADVPNAILMRRAAGLLASLAGADFAVTVSTDKTNKIQTIKFVRALNKVTLKVAKDLVEAGPVEVFRGPEHEARDFARNSTKQFSSLTMHVDTCA